MSKRLVQLSSVSPKQVTHMCLTSQYCVCMHIARVVISTASKKLPVTSAAPVSVTEASDACIRKLRAPTELANVSPDRLHLTGSQKLRLPLSVSHMEEVHHTMFKKPGRRLFLSHKLVLHVLVCKR